MQPPLRRQLCGPVRLAGRGLGGGSYKAQSSNACAGGGGGGGYYGGGAGCQSGGAGGSSFAGRAPAVQGLEQHDGVHSGPGVVTITWLGGAGGN